MTHEQARESFEELIQELEEKKQKLEEINKQIKNVVLHSNSIENNKNNETPREIYNKLKNKQEELKNELEMFNAFINSKQVYYDETKDDELLQEEYAYIMNRIENEISNYDEIKRYKDIENRLSQGHDINSILEQLNISNKEYTKIKNIYNSKNVYHKVNELCDQVDVEDRELESLVEKKLITQEENILYILHRNMIKQQKDYKELKRTKSLINESKKTRKLLKEIDKNKQSVAFKLKKLYEKIDNEIKKIDSDSETLKTMIKLDNANKKQLSEQKTYNSNIMSNYIDILYEIENIDTNKIKKTIKKTNQITYSYFAEKIQKKIKRKNKKEENISLKQKAIRFLSSRFGELSEKKQQKHKQEKKELIDRIIQEKIRIEQESYPNFLVIQGQSNIKRYITSGINEEYRKKIYYPLPKILKEYSDQEYEKMEIDELNKIAREIIVFKGYDKYYRSIQSELNNISNEKTDYEYINKLNKFFSVSLNNINIENKGALDNMIEQTEKREKEIIETMNGVLKSKIDDRNLEGCITKNMLNEFENIKDTTSLQSLSDRFRILLQLKQENEDTINKLQTYIEIEKQFFDSKEKKKESKEIMPSNQLKEYSFLFNSSAKICNNLDSIDYSKYGYAGEILKEKIKEAKSICETGNIDSLDGINTKKIDNSREESISTFIKFHETSNSIMQLKSEMDKSINILDFIEKVEKNKNIEPSERIMIKEKVENEFKKYAEGQKNFEELYSNMEPDAIEMIKKYNCSLLLNTSNYNEWLGIREIPFYENKLYLNLKSLIEEDSNYKITYDDIKNVEEYILHNRHPHDLRVFNIVLNTTSDVELDELNKTNHI